MNATAKCERTGKTVELAEGFLVAEPGSGEWQFLAVDAPEHHGDYSIPLEGLLLSPGSFVDWMAHLSEKDWFVSAKFFAFFHRFRQDNDLYGAVNTWGSDPAAAHAAARRSATVQARLGRKEVGCLGVVAPQGGTNEVVDSGFELQEPRE